MRLFVGLEIPRPIRLAMHERSARLRTSLPQASWVAAADYHLLLAFLGDTSEPAMGSVGAALSAAFGSHKGFDVQLAGAGASPPMRPARVLWIGVEDKAGLEGLHRSVWESLNRVVDIEADWKPYHAHSTVARCPKAWTRRCVEVWCRSCSGRVGDSFSIRRGALFSCEAGTGDSRYQVIETYPMRGAH